MFDPGRIRKDFPIFQREINGKPLVYLDSAATSQKPWDVVESIVDYYTHHNANVHRGAHTLGDESTKLWGQAHNKAAEFIGAEKSEEIIFVRNTTEAINLVAYAWGLKNLKKGDEVVVTEMEHHSNLVPWQQIAQQTGAHLEFVRVAEHGLLDMEDYTKKVKQAKLVAFTHVSNALGTINPVLEMTKLAHRAGAIVVVDGAQAVPHLPVSVQHLHPDFYAFSGHKCLGPMGIGVLYGRQELLESMEPFLTGGGMINEVHKETTSWHVLPDKFEAGTPNVAGAVGLVAAIEYLQELGMEEVRRHDEQMVEYALSKLEEVPNLRLLGPDDPTVRCGSVSFEYEGVHGHDVATVLDSEGVAVRSGHHCCMVLHEVLGLPASVRASFNVYTTKEDIDKLVEALGKVRTVFGK